MFFALAKIIKTPCWKIMFNFLCLIYTFYINIFLAWSQSRRAPVLTMSWSVPSGPRTSLNLISTSCRVSRGIWWFATSSWTTAGSTSAWWTRTWTACRPPPSWWSKVRKRRRRSVTSVDWLENHAGSAGFISPLLPLLLLTRVEKMKPSGAKTKQDVPSNWESRGGLVPAPFRRGLYANTQALLRAAHPWWCTLVFMPWSNSHDGPRCLEETMFITENDSNWLIYTLVERGKKNLNK